MACQVHHPLVCRYGNLARSIRSRSVPLVGPPGKVRVSALPVRSRAQPCRAVLSALLTPGLGGGRSKVVIRTRSWLKTVVAGVVRSLFEPCVRAGTPLASVRPRPLTPYSVLMCGGRHGSPRGDARGVLPAPAEPRGPGAAAGRRVAVEKAAPPGAPGPHGRCAEPENATRVPGGTYGGRPGHCHPGVAPACSGGPFEGWHPAPCGRSATLRPLGSGGVAPYSWGKALER